MYFKKQIGYRVRKWRLGYPYPVVESFQGSCGLDVAIKIRDYSKLVLALRDRGLLRVWLAGLQAGHRLGLDSLLHRNNRQIFTECFGLCIIISKYLLLVPVARRCACVPVT